MSGAKQAVVTDLDEPIREHVLEEATDELLGGDGAELRATSGSEWREQGERPAAGK
jgi:hypothetical protein